MKYLGIDFGEKRIGLALGDDKIKVAAPFKIVENQSIERVLAHILEVIRQENIEQIVIGVPYSLKEREGRIGNQEKEVLGFITRLGMVTTVPIAKEDERFTTAEVDKLMVGQKLPGGQRDAVSAMLILQSYFDRL